MAMPSSTQPTAPKRIHFDMGPRTLCGLPARLGLQATRSLTSTTCRRCSRIATSRTVTARKGRQ
jgi:hypothetical protein